MAALAYEAMPVSAVVFAAGQVASSGCVPLFLETDPCGCQSEKSHPKLGWPARQQNFECVSQA